MVSFFFFKQKTAYEMRISDWSSDVCSSDLKACSVPGRRSCWAVFRHIDEAARSAPRDRSVRAQPRRRHVRLGRRLLRPDGREPDGQRSRQRRDHPKRVRPRSAEHTSELKSLMRTSYDVCCLKKKKHKSNNY